MPDPDPGPDHAGRYDLSILGGAGDGRRPSRVVDECSTPDPGRYHDAATQYTSIDGAPLSAKMRPGRWGLAGTVIPRATYCGGSQGHDPHRPADNRVTVFDPFDARHNVTVDLSRVTAQSAREALRIVDRAAGPPRDIEELRTRQAATFVVLGQMADRDRGEPAMKFGNGAVAPPPSAPAPAPASFFPPPPPAPSRGDDPMAAFRTAAPPPPAAPPAAAGLGPLPQRMVTFGMPQGNFEAAFHSVIRQTGPDGRGGVLVLGLESAYRGPRFVPGASQEKFAVRVHGEPSVLLLEPMGVQFEHKGELLIQFLVADERPA